MSEPARKSAYTLAAAAGLLGAAGVALAAVAAHKVDSPNLVTAANMLMVHGAAGIGIASFAARQSDSSFVAVGSLMLAAVTLFAGDVTVHTLSGNHIFPYAAPTGGSLTIASWVLFSLVSLRNFWRGG